MSHAARIVVAIAALAALACGKTDGGAAAVTVTSNVRAGAVTPVLLSGDSCPGGAHGKKGACNPSCADLGYVDSYRLDGANLVGEPQTFVLDSLGHSLTVTSYDGVHFDWSSDLGIDKVLVKGGNAANEYVYDPPLESFGDTDLEAPVNASGKPAALGHVDFCYDYELALENSVSSAYARATSWTITKTGSATNLTVGIGQVPTVNYQVSVAGTPIDSNTGATGSVTITNPSPYTASVTSVTIAACGWAPPVDCGQPFPLTVASGSAVTCAYAGTLPPSAPGCADVATVDTAAGGHVKGGTATTTIAPAVVVDDCVSVDDDRAGHLGDTCATTSYSYAQSIRFGSCGDSHYLNTASFRANTSQTTGTSSFDVEANVACPPLSPISCHSEQWYWSIVQRILMWSMDEPDVQVGWLGSGPILVVASQGYRRLLGGWIELSPTSDPATYRTHIGGWYGSDVSVVLSGDRATVNAFGYETFPPFGGTKDVLYCSGGTTTLQAFIPW